MLTTSPSALLASTLLILTCLPLSTPHAIPARLTRRQGCSSLEPNDPNCELPLWNDKTYNLTFDDFPTSTATLTTYNNLLFSNFALVHPNLTSSAPMLLPFANSSTYARLPSNKLGHIAIDPAASTGSSTPKPLDFFKIQGLALGCTYPHQTTRTIATFDIPMNCTIQVTGMCAGPNSTSTQDVKSWSWDVGFEVPSGTRRAEVQWSDLGTYGEKWLCHNFTVVAIRADGERGRGPAVWVDQIEVVEYTESAIFGR